VALLNKGMNEADAETARRGDAVIIFDANSKIIPQLCNAKLVFVYTIRHSYSYVGCVTPKA
jgi:isoleucyl-tRNA synthetase